MLWGCPAEESPEVLPAEDPVELEVPDEHHHQHEPGEHMHHGHAHDAVDRSDQPLSGDLVDGTRVVSVEAKRYEFVPSMIVVRQGEPVRLEVTATDVTHGIELHGMDIDVPLPVNETQTIEFTPEEAGEYHVHCSVYCGPGHHEMHGTLIVRE